MGRSWEVVFGCADDTHKVTFDVAEEVLLVLALIQRGKPLTETEGGEETPFGMKELHLLGEVFIFFFGDVLLL